MTTTSPSSTRSTPLVRLLAVATVVLASSAAHAQFKVVGPDGKVTYTDRAPNANDGRVSAVGGRGDATAAEPELPFELRQIASKYPVTLYTATGACDACVAARQLLKERGIPYAERQATTTEDVDALEKLSGGRDAPTLTIGAQVLRGLAQDTWNQYLDAAGYPRESRLPLTYQQRPVGPIAQRREPPRAAASAPAARSNPPIPTTAPPPPGSIRF